MTDKYLIENGFEQFAPRWDSTGNIEIAFQKLYNDEIGKKYFIHVNKWRAIEHPHTHEIIGPHYEYKVQLYKKDSRSALDFTFHNDWTLEDVEYYIDEIFNTGMFDYYERFDNK